MYAGDLRDGRGLLRKYAVAIRAHFLSPFIVWYVQEVDDQQSLPDNVTRGKR